MIVIPAIDLMGGECVRLVQGRASDKKTYSGDPVSVAREFEEQGAALIHVVDLDGAFGKGGQPNLKLIERIASSVSVPIEVGGGIRKPEHIASAFDAGASRVIMGTSVLYDPEVLERACAEHPGRIVCGIDAKDGKVALKGWTETSQVDALELAVRAAGMGVKEIIYTDIARDGMLSGPNLDALRKICACGLGVIASGGVSSLNDILSIAELRLPEITGVIVGKAIYEGKIRLADSIEALRHFREMNQTC